MEYGASENRRPASAKLPLSTEEHTMPKGEQRSNKLAKKPKKDNTPPKDSTSDRPVPPITSVMPKGKLKNK
jgi:hypothetical protein